jgi:hypothetical protein
MTSRRIIGGIDDTGKYVKLEIIFECPKGHKIHSGVAGQTPQRPNRRKLRKTLDRTHNRSGCLGSGRSSGLARLAPDWIAIDDAAAMGSHIDSSINTRIARDLQDESPLMLVIVDARPGARFVG